MGDVLTANGELYTVNGAIMILIRYSEIGLKGDNRSFFEQQLVRNIEACLNAHNIIFEKIERVFGRIIVHTTDPCACLRDVFGIASFSNAVSAGMSAADALPIVLSTIQFSGCRTFRVFCQRLDKSFPQTSQEFARELGGLLVDKTGLGVDLTAADVVVTCEIIHKTVYLCTSTTQGHGGLPVGATGEVLVFVHEREDLLAAWFMLKRGCTLLIACPASLDLSCIEQFMHGHPLRRTKLEDFANRSEHALFAVVPDVIASLKDYSVHCPVVRPLIGMTDHERAANFESIMPSR